MSGRSERAACAVAWLAVATAGSVMITQVLGLDAGPRLAALQALTPYATLALAPVAAVALARRWHGVGATAAAVGLGGILLATPLVFPPGQPAPAPGAEPVRVAVVNLLYENERIDDVADALDAQRADMIVFTEYTAEHQSALLDHPLVDDFPHRLDRDGLRAGGTAVWSRHPIDPLEGAEMTNYDVEVAVGLPDGEFRLWAVHPPSPFDPAWGDDLATIGGRARTIDEPLLVAGDFNASYWHPAFRDLLRVGLTDAHMVERQGWSASWPTDEWFPAFVRIDHALTNDGLVTTDVADFDVPGSDHRGFVVTIAAAG